MTGTGKPAAHMIVCDARAKREPASLEPTLGLGTLPDRLRVHEPLRQTRAISPAIARPLGPAGVAPLVIALRRHTPAFLWLRCGAPAVLGVAPARWAG